MVKTPLSTKNLDYVVIPAKICYCGSTPLPKYREAAIASTEYIYIYIIFIYIYNIYIYKGLYIYKGFLGSSDSKLPAMQEDRVQSLGLGDPLK